MTDSRFDTSSWATEDVDDKVPGPSRRRAASDAGSASSSQFSSSQTDEEDLDEDEDEDLEEGNDLPTVKPLTADELEDLQRKQKKRGIIYISRIPPGMTPPKVRHLLSGFGEVERIYLQDGKKKEREARGEISRKSNRNHRFTEAWIEFASKSTAKVVASTLNANPIGFATSSSGRKANKNAKRWKDDVWTMKYLPGFKWYMLSEQMAHERAAHTARLRTELSQSKFEQADYLKKVERARVQRDKEMKKQQRAEKAAAAGSTSKVAGGSSSAVAAASSASGPGGKARTFQQRKPVLRDVRDQAKGEARPSKKRSASSYDAAYASKKSKMSSVSSRTAVGPSGSNDALQGVLSKIF